MAEVIQTEDAVAFGKALEDHWRLWVRGVISEA